MKKFLRLSLVALFATLCNVAFAEDILWSEDFSSYAANDVPTGGEYNYVCVNGGSTTKIFNEKLAGGEAPELLISKNNGSFSVTVPMNGKSGEMVLAFKANANRITVTAVDATLGDKVAAGTDYTYPVTVAEGIEEITFTFTNTMGSNVRFDNAKLYQGEAKKPAGLSWGTSSREVTIGAEENNFPTLTNANNLPVTYASDNTEVATINAEGNITLIAAGTTNISATFEGNEEYEAATVTYKLTVKPAADPSVDITNTPETAYTVAQAFELIAAGQGLDAKVYVKGYITNIKEVETTQFGNATYSLNDENTYNAETALLVYRGYYLDGEKFTAEDQIKVGDQVVVYGKLVNYNGTYEINTGSSIHSINGTTAVEEINAAAQENGQVYNLLGQPVSADTKNQILVKNGKKFINK